MIGALNLLLTAVGHVAERDAKLLRALADIATVGILQERLLNPSPNAPGLQAALASRIHIEHAKGIIAERNHLQIDAAFVKLRNYARDNNLRLTDVATGVIDRTIDF